MRDVQTNHLSKIIKRLELIKSLISLEEEDEIEAHVFKLEQFGITRVQVVSSADKSDENNSIDLKFVHAYNLIAISETLTQKKEQLEVLKNIKRNLN